MNSCEFTQIFVAADAALCLSFSHFIYELEWIRVKWIAWMVRMLLRLLLSSTLVLQSVVVSQGIFINFTNRPTDLPNIPPIVLYAVCMCRSLGKFSITISFTISLAEMYSHHSHNWTSFRGRGRVESGGREFIKMYEFHSHHIWPCSSGSSRLSFVVVGFMLNLIRNNILSSYAIVWAYVCTCLYDVRLRVYVSACARVLVLVLYWWRFCHHCHCRLVYFHVYDTTRTPNGNGIKWNGIDMPMCIGRSSVWWCGVSVVLRAHRPFPYIKDKH